MYFISILCTRVRSRKVITGATNEEMEQSSKKLFRSIIACHVHNFHRGKIRRYSKIIDVSLARVFMYVLRYTVFSLILKPDELSQHAYLSAISNIEISFEILLRDTFDSFFY